MSPQRQGARGHGLIDRIAGSRHDAWVTLTLHLGPGVLLTGAGVLLGRRAVGLGLPPIFGLYAAVLNTTLFAAYHLWSPWLVPTRIIATLPLFYATWRTRALGLAVTAHVALNLIGDTLASVPVTFR